MDGALACVEGAVRYGYEDIAKLKDDGDLAGLRKHPRFVAALSQRPSAGPGALDHLVITKNDKVYLVPTIGLHLYFEGDHARTHVAELLARLQRAHPEMFSHYLPRGHVQLEPAKKGRVERTLKELADRSRHVGKVYFNAAPEGAACDGRVIVELDSGAQYGGELSLHLPLAMADGPEVMLERLVDYASAMPFAVGQAGYSLAAYYAGNGCPVEADLRRSLKSHLGLTTSQACLHLVPDATFVVPNWITFLGGAAVKRLGAKAMAQLRKKKLVRELSGGSVAVVAAPAPFVGLVTSPGDLGALPDVVRALCAVAAQKRRRIRLSDARGRAPRRHRDSIGHRAGYAGRLGVNDSGKVCALAHWARVGPRASPDEPQPYHVAT